MLFSALSFASRATAQTAPPPASGVTLTSAPVTPQQEEGTVVTFTAQGQGGSGLYEYEFRLWSGAWSTVQSYSPDNTWVWQTEDVAIMTHQISVWVRNRGSVAANEATAAMNYALTAMPAASGVTLTSAPVTPQQEEGTVVTFTAQGQGGSGLYEYEFRLWSGAWSTVQSYSADNTWVWQTQDLAIMTHQISVRVRNRGSAAAYDAITAMNYALTVMPAASGVTLTSAPVTTQQEEGTVVTFTAQGQGGSGLYEYEFRLWSGAWSTVQSYSPDNTWVWQTESAAIMTHQISVRVRNGGSTATYDAITAMNYAVVAPPVSTAITVTANPAASTQAPGTSIQFTGDVTAGGGPYEYQFRLRGPSTGGAWQVAQAYSTTATWTWDTTGADGDSSVAVWARAVGSGAAREYTKTFGRNIAYTVPTVTLAPDLASPQVQGTNVTWTATGSGGSGSYQYQFWVYGPANRWIMQQDYLATNTLVWNTGSETAGIHEVRVRVRNTGSTAQYENAASVPYTVDPVPPDPLPSVTLASDLTSPQVQGTTVTWTATGSGGTGSYEYQFWVYGPANRWIMHQDYLANNTLVWNTSAEKAGIHEVRARVRNTGSTAQYENAAFAPYTLDPAPADPLPTVTAASNLPSPQPAGTTVNVTGTGAGGVGSYEYQFWVNGPITNYIWQMHQDYSAAGTLAWDTTALTGPFTVHVRVRNAGSTEQYENSTDLSYTVGPASIAVTTDFASPQEEGIFVTVTAVAAETWTGYEYEFYLAGPSTGEVLLLKQPYSLDNTWTWNTEDADGADTILVQTRYPGSTASYEAQETIYYTIAARPPCTAMPNGYPIPPAGYSFDLLLLTPGYMNGPVVLSRALAKWGDTATPDDLATLAGTTDPAGTTLAGFVAAIQARGVTPVETTLLYDDLATQVDDQNTAVMVYTVCGTFYWVRSVNATQVRVEDGRSMTAQILGRTEFENQWTGTTVLMIRPDNLMQ